MDIRIEIMLDNIKREDLRNIGHSENRIIEASLEAAGHAILKLEEVRLARFIRFCQTGKFD